ncbi:hypothetical protein ACWTU6_31295 [Mesorhizobium sp. BHbsci]
MIEAAAKAAWGTDKGIVIAAGIIAPGNRRLMRSCPVFARPPCNTGALDGRNRREENFGLAQRVICCDDII